MTRRLRPRHLLVAGIAAAAAWAAPQAAVASPSEADLPTVIQVEAGHKMFLEAHAVGVQIHACDATLDGFGWRFVGPRADLYDDRGRLVSTHFGGPTWQATDGSRVVGQRVDGVTVDPTAIPWLLLSAASTAAGDDGDRLQGTKFIQRIATTGGLVPPPGECNASTAGTVAEVPYTADYRFWKRTGG